MCFGLLIRDGNSGFKASFSTAGSALPASEARGVAFMPPKLRKRTCHDPRYRGRHIFAGSCGLNGYENAICITGWRNPAAVFS